MKKSLSLLLAIAMVFGLFASVVSAADNELTTQQKFDALKAKGIFAGLADGSAGLDQEMTRAQAARIIALLKGLEGIGETDTRVVTEKPFPDVELGKWYTEEVDAVKADGSFKGNADGTFNPNGQLTVQELAVAVAAALGFDATKAEAVEIEGAATWAGSSIKFLQDAGYAVPTNYTANALRGQLVDATFVADAVLNPVAPAFAAAQTGAKKIVVNFGAAVDDTKVKLSVTNGTISVNYKTVSFADDKKSATIEFANNLVAAEYTVKAEGVSAEALTTSVKVEASKVNKIDFASNNIVVNRGNPNEANLSYKVLNQFGENVTASEAVNVTTSKGTVVSPNSTGTVTITNAGGFTLNENIMLTALHSGTSTFASVTGAVVAPSRISTVDLVELQGPKDKELQVGYTPQTDFKILVDLKDQYGNSVTDVTYWTDDVVLSNPENAIKLNAPVVESGKVYLKVNTIVAAGNTTITLVSLTTGNRDALDIAVKDSVKVDSLALTAPALAPKGETVEIPYTALDQFGAAVKHPSGISLNASGAGAGGASVALVWSKDIVKDTTSLKLDIDATASSTIVISGVTPTGKFVQLTFNTSAAKEAKTISGVKKIDSLLKGDSKAVNAAANVVIKDQYNRDMDLPAGWKVKSSISGSSVTSDVNEFPLTYTGAAKGASTITLTLNDGTKDIANSSYTFSLNVVEKSQIVSYEATVAGTVYNDADPKYSKALTVVGLLADGSKVSIPDSADNYEVIINTANVTYGGGKVSAAGFTGFSGSATEAEVPVIVLVKGATTQTLTVTAKISKDTPVATTLALQTAGGGTKSSDELITVANAAVVDTQGELETLVAAVVKATDQYGQEITEVYAVRIATNFAGASDLAGLGEGDSFTVTAVTDNNKTIQFKILVLAD